MYFQNYYTYLLRVEIVSTAKSISCAEMVSCVGEVIIISSFAMFLAMAIVSDVFASFVVRFVAYN